MKRFVMIVSVCLAILGIISFAPSVYAAEDDSYESQLGRDVDTLFADNDLDLSYAEAAELTFSKIVSKIRDSVSDRIRAPFKLLLVIIVLIVFSSFMSCFIGNSPNMKQTSDLSAFLCTASAIAAISVPLLEVFRTTADSLDRSGAYITSFVPIYAGIILLSGGAVSAELYSGVTLIGADLMVWAANSVVIPLLTVMMVLAIMGSVFPNSFADAVSNLIKKAVTWSMTVAVTLFSGFVTLRSTLGAKADGFAAKTAKFVISGFVPVVGSAVSDAYSAVKGSFELMRCTVGFAGVVAAAFIFLPPLIELIAFRAMVHIGIFAAEGFDSKAVAKLLKGIDSGLAIAMSILICFGLFFIICTASLMKAVG